MENFFTHSCHKCGGIDEAKFTVAGPHVKQICLHCGCYVKFFDKSLIPAVAEIRMKIWGISKGNVDIIEKAKEAVAYHEMPDKTGLYAKLVWWKVYLKVRAIIPTQ